MIKKSVFENDLITGMQTELHKQASVKQPDLVKAAECLHSALEIFESQGLEKQSDQVLQILEKIAQNPKPKSVMEMPSINKLMEAGLTRRDLHEFSKGNPIAKAKLNLVLRSLGLSEHHIGKFLGTHNVMSEKEAREIADPNRTFSKMWDWMKEPTLPIDPAHPKMEEKIHQWIQDPTVPVDPTNPQPGETLRFESKAQKKTLNDWHTKKLTPEKQVKNILDHGTQFNMANDGLNVPSRKDHLTKDDMDADFVDLLDASTFDIDASDDELMGMEVKDDSLEVFDEGMPMSDFEDEKD